MPRLIAKYLSIIITIYVLSIMIDTIYIDDIPSLLVMGLIILIVNLIVKPFILLISLPISLITLGLFNFVINAWMIMLADLFIREVAMGGFLNSLLTAFIISVLHHFLRDAGKESAN